MNPMNPGPVRPMPMGGQHMTQPQNPMGQMPGQGRPMQGQFPGRGPMSGQFPGQGGPFQPQQQMLPMAQNPTAPMMADAGMQMMQQPQPTGGLQASPSYPQALSTALRRG